MHNREKIHVHVAIQLAIAIQTSYICNSTILPGSVIGLGGVVTAWEEELNYMKKHDISYNL